MKRKKKNLKKVDGGKSKYTVSNNRNLSSNGGTEIRDIVSNRKTNNSKCKKTLFGCVSHLKLTFLGKNIHGLNALYCCQCFHSFCHELLFFIFYLPFFIFYFLFFIFHFIF